MCADRPFAVRYACNKENLLPLPAARVREENTMEKQDFNTGWTFERLGTDTPACRVDLPHDAMLGEPRREDCPGGTNTGWFEGHDYRYSKTLTLTESQAGQTVLLEFEGVYHNAVVEVNGTRVAGRPYGYSNFTADLTGRVRAGDNTVTVTARNADQPNSRWYSGAGIYRPVWLYQAPAEHIRLDGVRVQTLGLEPPRAGFSICTTAPGWLTVTVTDTAGKTLAVESRPTPGNTRFPLDLPQAPLWSCEAPNLCRCTVEFSREEGGAVLDRSQVTFGLRTLRWDTRQGLCLNGSRVILRGACIHHDNGLLLPRRRRAEGGPAAENRLQCPAQRPQPLQQGPAGRLRPAGDAGHGRVCGLLVHP